VVAEAYQIPAKLVFNKIDLYDEHLMEQLEGIIQTYENIGYTCLKTSMKEEKNLNNFHSMLMNKTSLLVGNSGVGKSSLINSIDPGIDLKVGEISSYHKSGKHTTTFAEMFPLSSGGHVIDTPGIKGFGLVNVDKEEIYHFFPEIFEKAKECKYHNCLHDNEPGCAVKEAVIEGSISESRYFNYMSLLTEEEGKYR
jgi:ribosome biogenesis GTPase